jgi:23S rRNA (pseudouridine1915-N3)-methyltransferase
MRIEVHAVGRLKTGPARELADRYFDLLAKTGPAVGLEFAGVHETQESRNRSADERRREEGERLKARLVSGTALILLDEHGKNIGSEDFAGRIGMLRDAGRRSLVLAIGGPDGHDPALANAAELVVALGSMTWPHQIVRLLVAEQLYRAATILAGHPYHRA